MEGTLKVTPEKLTATASEFQSKGSRMQSLTQQMTSTVTGLSSIWTGEAATAYTKKFSELQDDMDKMKRMIDEHVTDLNEMARVYQQAEKANEELASGLSGDVIVYVMLDRKDTARQDCLADYYTDVDRRHEGENSEKK